MAAGARITSPSASVPEAPGLFSGTMVAFSVLPISMATARPRVSEPPPGARGSSRRMGLADWAAAMPGSTPRLVAAITARAVFRTVRLESMVCLLGECGTQALAAFGAGFAAAAQLNSVQFSR
ncbi:hypothetical protein D3C78_1382030 [compost metagenome]